MLDVKDADDLATLRALLETADVFVENFRDETLAKMGLAPDQLRQSHPTLVVASCKSFLKGRYEHRAVMDEVVQIMAGMAYMTGPKGRPFRIGSSANDIMGGLFAAYGVLGTLIRRGKTGQGAAVRSGLFENCLLLVAQHTVQFDIEGEESPPMPEGVFSWPIYELFETADGRQILVGAATAGQWEKLCIGLGLEHLLADDRLKTRPDQIRARDWTLPHIAAVIAARPFDEMVQVMEANDLLFAPVSRPAEMFDDPHVNRPGGLFTSEYRDEKAFRAPAVPVEIDGPPIVSEGVAVPSVGEHTAEILGALKVKA